MSLWRSSRVVRRMGSMLLIRNGSMIVLIGIFFPRFFPGHTTIPPDFAAGGSFARGEIEKNPFFVPRATAFPVRPTPRFSTNIYCLIFSNPYIDMDAIQNFWVHG